MTESQKSFAERFGEDQASAILAAAEQHRPKMLEGGKHGSDAFADAIVICIGFECISEDAYRAAHGITTPLDSIREWLLETDLLATYDGPVDYLAFMAGAYQPYYRE